MEIICFLANVRQYNIMLYVFIVVLNLCSCQPCYRLINKAYLGLSEWKITNIHQILTIMFENVLRATEDDEILKIFKNIQPQPKN